MFFSFLRFCCCSCSLCSWVVCSQKVNEMAQRRHNCRVKNGLNCVHAPFTFSPRNANNFLRLEYKSPTAAATRRQRHVVSEMHICVRACVSALCIWRVLCQNGNEKRKKPKTTMQNRRQRLSVLVQYVCALVCVCVPENDINNNNRGTQNTITRATTTPASTRTNEPAEPNLYVYFHKFICWRRVKQGETMKWERRTSLWCHHHAPPTPRAAACHRKEIQISCQNFQLIRNENETY